ncbi:YggT family protein [Anaeropeptidivorans aminofermentans]|uniref:YggT family protein n=1 Tax=Anaeropeptidivorans aminofermentans TaxID=2934315 RepID=UPI002023DB31|nr:YggT family protein [Anaeropeptidivorans aminofermentans]MBE6013015.1 YggT family protein [Lachnospiraceae bacterium]
MRDILARSIGQFANLLDFLILISCIMSWLPINRDSFIPRTITALTEPLMSPVRKLLYKSPLGGPGMMLDFSPVIVILLINLISGLLQTLIYSF